MKTLIALLLLICFNVQAEHHRGHALGYLQGIEQRVDNILGQIEDFAAVVEPGTHPQQLTYENGELGGIFPGNIEGIRDRVIRAQNALNGTFDPLCNQFNPPSDENELDCARRLINQPNHVLSPRSALQYAHSAMYGMTIFILWEDYEGRWPSDGNLSIVTGQLNEIWGDLDQALWHINDAIREEIYLDPDFGE